MGAVVRGCGDEGCYNEAVLARRRRQDFFYLKLRHCLHAVVGNCCWTAILIEMRPAVRLLQEHGRWVFFYVMWSTF